MKHTIAIITIPKYFLNRIINKNAKMLIMRQMTKNSSNIGCGGGLIVVAVADDVDIPVVVLTSIITVLSAYSISSVVAIFS